MSGTCSIGDSAMQRQSEQMTVEATTRGRTTPKQYSLRQNEFSAVFCSKKVKEASYDDIMMER